MHLTAPNGRSKVHLSFKKTFHRTVEICREGYPFWKLAARALVCLLPTAVVVSLTCVSLFLSLRDYCVPVLLQWLEDANTAVSWLYHCEIRNEA